MLFPEQDEPQIKAWIINRLQGTSDADPDVLADYVLALLRHDGDMTTVRALCEAEIPDFLQADATAFVQDIFDAILYKTYLPSNNAPVSRPSIPFAPPTGPSYVPAGPSAQSYGSLGMAGAPSGPQNASRKRSYNDRGDGDAQDRSLGMGDPNGRVFKQARRGNMEGGMGRGSFGGMNDGRGGYHGRPPSMNAHGTPSFPGMMPPMPTPPLGMPSLGDDPLSAMLAMQAMGVPLPPGLGAPSLGQRPPLSMPAKKHRCRDYDLKGFCARGNTCKFDHGQESIYVPPSGVEEYDPTNATLVTPTDGHQPAGRGGFTGLRGNGFARGRGGQQNKGGRRSEFSSDRPNYDKTKTTIVIENIPEEKFKEDEVRSFFSEFGNILEVDMRPYKRLAIVKFDSYDAAKTAHGSPKVIFDNRFVKVYWFVDQESLPQPPTNGSSKFTNGIKTGDIKMEDGESTPIPYSGGATEPPMNLEEFAKKQKEIQEAHAEKMKKKAEVENQRKELEQRQLAQAEEKKKLMEKIAAMSSGKVASPISKLESGTPAPAADTTTGDTKTEAAKALLAKLQAEAKSLGIDTALTDDTYGGLNSRGGYRGRGGFRGRGSDERGGYRGRGTFVPRGARGGYRGRGGGPFVPAGGGKYNLDNRTKKVGIRGIDFTDSQKEESLREHLFVSELIYYFTFNF